MPIATKGMWKNFQFRSVVLNIVTIEKKMLVNFFLKSTCSIFWAYLSFKQNSYKKVVFPQVEGPTEKEFLQLYSNALVQLLELRELGYTAAVVTQASCCTCSNPTPAWESNLRLSELGSPGVFTDMSTQPGFNLID